MKKRAQSYQKVSKKGQKKRRVGSPGGREFPSDAVMYRGPARSGLEMSQTRCRTIPLTYNFNVTAAAGVINNAFGTNPSSAPGWTQLAAIYDEYRILALEVAFTPYNADYSSVLTASTTPPIVTVIDHDSGTPLTGYSGLTTGGDSFSSLKTFISTKKWRRIARMSDFQEASFVSTGSSPTKQYYIKLWGGTFAPVTMTVGLATIVYNVQFRGRGL